MLIESAYSSFEEFLLCMEAKTLALGEIELVYTDTDSKVLPSIYERNIELEKDYSIKKNTECVSLSDIDEFFLGAEVQDEVEEEEKEEIYTGDEVYTNDGETEVYNDTGIEQEADGEVKEYPCEDDEDYTVEKLGGNEDEFGEVSEEEYNGIDTEEGYWGEPDVDELEDDSIGFEDDVEDEEYFGENYESDGETNFEEHRNIDEEFDDTPVDEEGYDYRLDEEEIEGNFDVLENEEIIEEGLEEGIEENFNEDAEGTEDDIDNSIDVDEFLSNLEEDLTPEEVYEKEQIEKKIQSSNENKMEKLKKSAHFDEDEKSSIKSVSADVPRTFTEYVKIHPYCKLHELYQLYDRKEIDKAIKIGKLFRLGDRVYM